MKDPSIANSNFFQCKFLMIDTKAWMISFTNGTIIGHTLLSTYIFINIPTQLTQQICLCYENAHYKFVSLFHTLFFRFVLLQRRHMSSVSGIWFGSMQVNYSPIIRLFEHVSENLSIWNMLYCIKQTDIIYLIYVSVSSALKLFKAGRLKSNILYRKEKIVWNHNEI